MPFPPPAFCSFCGQPHTAQACPATCSACGRITYANPLPVAVAVVPLADEGCLVIQRAMAPGVGQWALPGGFVDAGESAVTAVAREVGEEAGLWLDPGAFRLTGESISPDGRHLLLWCEHEGPRPALSQASPGSESLAVGASTQADLDWAFGLHRDAAARWQARHVPWNRMAAAGWQGKHHPHALHQGMSALVWSLRQMPDATQSLLQAGADPDAISKPEGSALLWASKRGTPEQLHMLLAHGAQPHLAGPQGRYALQAAAKAGQTGHVQRLLHSSARTTLDAQDAKGCTALMLACQEGHGEVIQSLMEAGARVDLEDDHRRTALSWAVQEAPGHVEALLAAGSNVGATNIDGWSVLHLAAAATHEHAAATVARLLGAGASPRAMTRNGDSALSVAIPHAAPEMIRSLLRAGSEVNLVTGTAQKGWSSPLLLALRHGRADLVDLLLDHGALPHFEVPQAPTALAKAADMGPELIAADLFDKMLSLSHGAAADTLGAALMGAARNGWLHAVDRLIEAGARVEWKNPQGETPLMEAARRGAVDVVQRLLGAGADRLTLTTRADNAIGMAWKGDHALVLDILDPGWPLDHRNVWRAIQYNARSCLGVLVEQGLLLTEAMEEQCRHPELAQWLRQTREKQALAGVDKGKRPGRAQRL